MVQKVERLAYFGKYSDAGCNSCGKRQKNSKEWNRKGCSEQSAVWEDRKMHIHQSQNSHVLLKSESHSCI